MKTIVGVRFRHTGKSFYYDPGDLEMSIGTPVIVKTADGLDCGRVSIPPLEREEENMPSIVKQIVRIATEEDLAVIEDNHRREEEAYVVCKKKIAELGLPMKLIHAEYTFEKNKLMFYFSAEGRVDFRELVRLLATEFHTRIELRQIGVRDETKMLGGIGICGRELCCNTYLSGFTPVSIKMAKEQNLSLNPTKISGVCGRLMCCLAHEEEAYEYLNRTMPKSGDFATNVEGQTGVIRSVNILKQSVLVIFEDGDVREMKEYPVSEVGLTQRREGVPSPEKVQEIQRELEEVLQKKLEEEMLLLKERQGDNLWDLSGDKDSTEQSGDSNGKDRSDRQGSRRRRKGGDKRGRGGNAGSQDGDGRERSRKGSGKGRDRGSKAGGQDSDSRERGRKGSGKGDGRERGRDQGGQTGDGRERGRDQGGQTGDGRERGRDQGGQTGDGRERSRKNSGKGSGRGGNTGGQTGDGRERSRKGSGKGSGRGGKDQEARNSEGRSRDRNAQDSDGQDRGSKDQAARNGEDRSRDKGGQSGEGRKRSDRNANRSAKGGRSGGKGRNRSDDRSRKNRNRGKNQEQSDDAAKQNAKKDGAADNASAGQPPRRNGGYSRGY